MKEITSNIALRYDDSQLENIQLRGTANSYQNYNKSSAVNGSQSLLSQQTRHNASSANISTNSFQPQSGTGKTTQSMVRSNTTKHIQTPKSKSHYQKLNSSLSQKKGSVSGKYQKMKNKYDVGSNKKQSQQDVVSQEQLTERMKEMSLYDFY